MPGILAIDQATVSGWAFALPGEWPTWGHHRAGHRNAWEGSIFRNFRQFIIGLIESHQPEWLVFEAPFTPRPDRRPEAKPLNPETLRRGHGFSGHLTALVDEFALRCEEYQSAEVAKFMTGRGRFPGDSPEERTRAKKKAMIDACWARGWQVTHDEADALGMLMFAEHRLFPRIALRRKRIFRPIKGPLFENAVT